MNLNQLLGIDHCTLRGPSKMWFAILFLTISVCECFTRFRGDLLMQKNAVVLGSSPLSELVYPICVSQRMLVGMETDWRSGAVDQRVDKTHETYSQLYSVRPATILRKGASKFIKLAGKLLKPFSDLRLSFLLFLVFQCPAHCH